jgi:hypothetical protein
LQKNPFFFYTLPLDAPFCNRLAELKELTSYAASGANVVLFSPRRYGKTSLVKRVQKRFAESGGVTIFADFFGVATVDEVAARLAKAVFTITHRDKPLWKTALKAITSFRPVLKPDAEAGVTLSVEAASSGRGGLSLLEETMESLSTFMAKTDRDIHVALDEFQEIVELKEALQVEAALRTHIQHQRNSYFFVGSRRRVLLGIFNERQRPFFQSAINYELKRLPAAELATYVRERFAAGGKECPEASARLLVSSVTCHPYYAQKLAFFVFELPGPVGESQVGQGLEQLILAETPTFEALLQGLSLHQRTLLQTLALEPTDKLLAGGFMARHRLGSLSGIQHSARRLERLDLIEKDAMSGAWQVIDPVFAMWLVHQVQARLK